MPGMNVSSPLIGGITAMNTFSSFLPIIIVVILAAIILGTVITVLSSLDRYKKVWAFLGWMGTTARYFGYGLVGWGAIAGLWFVATSISSGIENKSIDLLFIGTWIGIIVAFFFGTTGMGYALKKGYAWATRKKSKYDKVLRK